MRTVLLLPAVVLTFSSIAHAQSDTPRVGVVVSVHVNLEAAQALEISRDLGAALTAELVVDVMAGEEVARRLPTDKDLQQCFVDVTCIADIGSRLEADQLLFLVIVRVGDELQIDPVWAEVASGRSVSRPAIKIVADADRSELFRQAARSLIPNAAIRPPQASQEIGRPDITGQPTTRSQLTPGVWVAGGVAVLALAGGVGFGLAAKSADDALQEDGCDQMQCANEDSRVDSLKNKMLAADVLYGVSLVAGITAIVLYVRSAGSEEATPNEGLSVTAFPDGASVTFSGRF